MDETEVTQPEEVPTEAPNMAAVRQYYTALQGELAQRASEIEAFLGFVEGSEALGTRLARIEKFLGLK